MTLVRGSLLEGLRMFLEGKKDEALQSRSELVSEGGDRAEMTDQVDRSGANLDFDRRKAVLDQSMKRMGDLIETINEFSAIPSCHSVISEGSFVEFEDGFGLQRLLIVPKKDCSEPDVEVTLEGGQTIDLAIISSCNPMAKALLGKVSGDFAEWEWLDEKHRETRRSSCTVISVF